MNINISKIRHTLWVMLTLAMVCGSTSTAFNQEDDSPPEKNRARLTLSYYNINNTTQKLAATVKTRVEGFYTPVSDVEIQFYRNEVSEENLLGTTATGINGEAILEFKPDSDTALLTTFIAVLENNPELEDTEEEIEIKKGILNMETEEADSVRTIRIFVGEPDSEGNITPISDVEVRAYVKRLFGLMAVTEEAEYTDEEGYLEAEFPYDIPGDVNGNLTIVARVIDNDELGYLEFNKTIAWGVPNTIDREKLTKELWLSHSNVPNILLILTNILLLGIFGLIGYVIYQLFNISKLGLSN